MARGGGGGGHRPPGALPPPAGRRAGGGPGRTENYEPLKTLLEECKDPAGASFVGSVAAGGDDPAEYDLDSLLDFQGPSRRSTGSPWGRTP